MFTFKQDLVILEQKGLKRTLRMVESDSSAWCIIDGKKVFNLCSNNYLGLANDRRLKEAVVEAVKNFGSGSGASRLISGNTKLHSELEQKLAEFKKTESALVFNSGYTANIGIISALVSKNDIVFCDKLNHASIIDGIILSRAGFKRYPHKDINVLDNLLKNSKNFRRKIIITDSVFSMDGDIAPLAELICLAKEYDCLLIIDEAHATGVLGDNGRGTLEYLGLEDEKNNIIQMGTFSKALGSFGAYVCANRDIIDYLINFSRAFIYTTALPASIIAANIEALRIIQNEPELRVKLRKNVKFFKDKLNILGFDTGNCETPIVPLITKDPKLTMEFSNKLFDEGVFVQGIRPPAVPENKSRLRITLMTAHTAGDLEFALDKIKNIAKDLCLI